MRNDFIAIDKSNVWKRAEKEGVATEAKEKKKHTQKKPRYVTRVKVKKKTGRLSSSAVHDHLDQFCKRDETTAVSFAPPRAAGCATPVFHLRGAGDKCCVRKQIHPPRQKERRATERKRVSQSLLTPIQPKRLALGYDP